MLDAFLQEQKTRYLALVQKKIFVPYFANSSQFPFPLGPLNQTQMDDLEEVIIEHHLHVSKHMIMLLKLNPDQLEPLDDSLSSKRIKRYLFNIISKLEFPWFQLI